MKTQSVEYTLRKFRKEFLQVNYAKFLNFRRSNIKGLEQYVIVIQLVQKFEFSIISNEVIPNAHKFGRQRRGHFWTPEHYTHHLQYLTYNIENNYSVLYYCLNPSQS